MKGRLYQMICAGLLLVLLPLGAFTVLAGFDAHALGHGHHDCPFMPGEQSVCSMNVLDHLAAWKAVFTTSSSYPLTVPLILVVFLATLGFGLSPGVVSRFVRKWFEYKNTPSLYQILFADGLLNPKTY